MTATILFAALAVRVWRRDNIRVSVGTDGVRLRSRDKTTFHPFATIAGVSTDGKEVTLQLADGKTSVVHNPRAGKLNRLSDRNDDARALASRIEAQLANYRAEPAPDASAVARNGRSAAEWIKGASALRESKVTFRTNVIPTEQLWRIVEDPTSSATARAGAALALRHDLDDADRVRLRVAADACAAPNLRVALETVAKSEDEAALLEAFEPLADQPARTMPMRTMSK